MKAAIVQYEIIWEDITANLRKIEELVKDCEVDLIVLPEMFSTGFTMTPENGNNQLYFEVKDWMISLSKDKNCMIAGSTVWPSDDGFYNRFLVCQNDIVQTYDKKHLFKYGDEHLHYRAGSDQLIFEMKEFRLRPLICYDLRFPVWSRNNCNYHILIYVANWPAARQDAWNSLLKARAIENQSYVIGVNRIGTDGRQINYVGGSQVFSFDGNTLMDLKQKESVGIAELEFEPLMKFREKYPFLNDRDDFELK